MISVWAASISRNRAAAPLFYTELMAGVPVAETVINTKPSRTGEKYPAFPTWNASITCQRERTYPCGKRDSPWQQGVRCVTPGRLGDPGTSASALSRYSI